MDADSAGSTLTHLSNSNYKQTFVLLRFLYAEKKEVAFPGKKPFWKAVLRFVDLKGTGLYAEVRGSTSQEVGKHITELSEMKFVKMSNFLPEPKRFYAGQCYVDLSAKGNKPVVKQLPMSHPNAVKLASVFPEAKSNFNELAQHCEAAEKHDLIGVITNISARTLRRAEKTEISLKDHSGKELLVSLWGNHFKEEASKLCLGEVVQIENATLLRKEDKSVEATAEHFLDNEWHNFARLLTGLSGKKTTALKELGPERGVPISTPWQASIARGEILRLQANLVDTYVSCAASMQACSLAVGDNEEGIVEVVLHGMWITHVYGTPWYVPCEKCGTKIDELTQQCKSSFKGCESTPAAETKILATVDVADATGVLSKVLVEETEFMTLAGCKSKEGMLKQLQEKGPQSICFRTQFDLRMVTAPKMEQFRGGKQREQASQASTILDETQSGLSQASNSKVEAPEAQFQILFVRECLLHPFQDNLRPMVPKVLRLQGKRSEGAVLPAGNPFEELQQSSMGTFHLSLNVFPSYVALVAVARDEPTLSEKGAGESKQLMIRHDLCHCCASGKVVENHVFVMEACCDFKNCVTFNMADGESRLLVGKWVHDEDEEKYTLVTEKVFRLKPDQESEFHKQRLDIHHVLAGEPRTTEKKRPARDLTTATPSKRTVKQW